MDTGGRKVKIDTNFQGAVDKKVPFSMMEEKRLGRREVNEWS